jgi:hypothetical protein
MKTQSIFVPYEDLADYLRDRCPNFPEDLEVIAVKSSDIQFGVVEFTIQSDTFPYIPSSFKRPAIIHDKSTDFEVYDPKVRRVH